MQTSPRSSSRAVRSLVASLMCCLAVLVIAGCGSSAKKTSKAAKPATTTPTAPATTTSTVAGGSAGARAQLLTLNTAFEKAKSQFGNANASGSRTALASSSKTFAAAAASYAAGLTRVSRTAPALVTPTLRQLSSELNRFSTVLKRAGAEATADDLPAVKREGVALAKLELQAKATAEQLQAKLG